MLDSLMSNGIYRTDPRSRLEIKAQDLIQMAEERKVDIRTLCSQTKELLQEAGYREIYHGDLIIGGNQGICYRYFQYQNNLTSLSTWTIDKSISRCKLKKRLHQTGDIGAALYFVPNTTELLDETWDLAYNPLSWI